MKPYWTDGKATLYCGDCREVLAALPAESVHCVVTSPPYLGLRDYGLPPSVWGGAADCEHEWQGQRYYVEGGGGAKSSREAFSEAGPENAERIKKARWRQDSVCAKCGAWLGCLGLEPSPEMFVEHLTEVFREVRRVLRPDGVAWMNLGDSYNAYNGNRGPAAGVNKTYHDALPSLPRGNGLTFKDFKPKDMLGMPWRVAFALQSDGWYLRSASPWVKRSAMPESVEDRPSTALEYIFLLTKSPRYFYDAEAVRKPFSESGLQRQAAGRKNQWGHVIEANGHSDARSFEDAKSYDADAIDPARGRNRRNSDWWFESVGMLMAEDGLPLGFDVSPKGYAKAHFATFPESLIEPCILAGTSEHGCCAACGAFWERVTEKGECIAEGGKSHRYFDARMDDRRLKDTDTSMKAHSRLTLGWQPTCTCGADVQPCTVLDPFAGSGTTLFVARKNGCRSIGIDLNTEYCRLVIDRLRQRTLV